MYSRPPWSEIVTTVVTTPDCDTEQATTTKWCGDQPAAIVSMRCTGRLLRVVESSGTFRPRTRFLTTLFLQVYSPSFLVCTTSRPYVCFVFRSHVYLLSVRWERTWIAPASNQFDRRSRASASAIAIAEGIRNRDFLFAKRSPGVTMTDSHVIRYCRRRHSGPLATYGRDRCTTSDSRAALKDIEELSNARSREAQF